MGVFKSSRRKFFRRVGIAHHGIYRCSQKQLTEYYLYKTPLELGIALARRGSISTAIRIALANALKVASMI